MTESNENSSFLSGYGTNFILLALGAYSSLESIAEDSRKELREYLKSPRDVNVRDPIKWWRIDYLFWLLFHLWSDFSITHNNTLLCLELLVIIWLQGSSVASERAFSSAEMTDDLCRNCLEAEAFGKLQILKYAYHTNFLNGSEEAALHKAVHEIEIK